MCQMSQVISSPGTVAVGSTSPQIIWHREQKSESRSQVITGEACGETLCYSELSTCDWITQASCAMQGVSWTLESQILRTNHVRSESFFRHLSDT